ncbi:hypothetical protein [Paenibacillus sp. 481]|uniref:hypothetical protein n=1 Tax=Paenibacillus sp. 481 TaxID=2835869 RepID=UPI001E48AAA6|nr:hypothetical protein [Paenibacillus sp. 481]UHA71776.1 hypothetical protein KIK04_13440 [Paenibacillus sp. 481]
MKKWTKPMLLMVLAVMLAVTGEHAAWAAAEKSGIGIEVPAKNGEFVPAEATQLWSTVSKEMAYVFDLFADPTGSLLFSCYQTEAGETILKAVHMKDGKTAWRISLGKDYSLRRTPKKVSANGEILLEGDKGNHMIVHAINAQTGKITRHATQKLPKKNTYFSWDYWITNDNSLLVSYALGNQSTLRYYDQKGRLVQTKKLSGILKHYDNGRYVLVSSTSVGRSFSTNLRIQNEQNKVLHKFNFPAEAYWNTYFFKDGSFAFELSRMNKGDEIFKLYRYSAAGKLQWQYGINRFMPYHMSDKHVFVNDYKHRKLMQVDKGKAVTTLTHKNIDYLHRSSSKGSSFTLKTNNGYDILIATADPLSWRAKVTAPHEVDVLWLGAGRIFIFEQEAKQLSVMKMQG